MIIRFAAILNVTFASDSHFPPNREILGLLKKIGTNQVRSNQNCHQVSTIWNNVDLVRKRLPPN